MRDKKPDDQRERVWFNWPMVLGLLLNAMTWAGLAAIWLLFNRR